MRLVFLVRCAFLIVLAGAVSSAQTVSTVTGVSSSQSPYVVPAAPGWTVASILSVGDRSADGRYAMAGIPDGLGALPGRLVDGEIVPDTGYMTVFMNHEIPSGSGISRAHGQPGAFVSQWTIALDTLRVQNGQDLDREVYTWDAASARFLAATATPSAQFNRLCSADLPARTAFYNPATGNGFDGRLYLNGEETTGGRAFAHVLTGPFHGLAAELAYLGRFAWENAVPHPNLGDKTVVVGLNDSTPGQVFIYIGDKRSSGNPIERAGLIGGALYGIKVVDGGANYSRGPVARENNGPISGRFVLENVSDVAVGSGTALQDASVARGVTGFARPEDGAWDPQNPRVFYFVVTGAAIDGQGQSARLYKLTFDGSGLAGTIELIIDRATLTPSTPTFAQFDNITVTGDGLVMVQEDPGNTPYIAQTWVVNPVTRTATAVLQSDPVRFGAPPLPPYNVDEESSGIIEVTDIVRTASWFEAGRLVLPRRFAGPLLAPRGSRRGWAAVSDRVAQAVEAGLTFDTRTIRERRHAQGAGAGD